MKLDKLTTVRIVDAIEPLLAFWCDVLGYAKKTEVPHGSAIGFVILDGPGGELMFQTRASLADDLPPVAARSPQVILFAEVASLPEVQRAFERAKGVEVLIPERKTPYGTRETVIADSQGTIVIFAEQAG